MAKYSIANESEKKLSDAELKKIYDECKKNIGSKKGEYPNFDFSDLDYIFKVACANRKLFPTINISENASPKAYIQRWINSYCNAISNPPSKKKATPKTTCNDPIIKSIVMISQNIKDDSAETQINVHNRCMSAENVLGNLLEEYIAAKIRPYKWIWCAGETLRAIDFCNEDGTILLQIKNKNNSENSSSSNIREGTSIKKWYRLTTSKAGGKISPLFRWNKLNEIINDTLPKGKKKINLSEDDFKKHIEKIVKNNPEIITEK